MRTQNTHFFAGKRGVLYRTARTTPETIRFARHIISSQTRFQCQTTSSLSKMDKAELIAGVVNEYPERTYSKKRRRLGFGKSAHTSIRKGRSFDALPCIEKTNMTLALLRSVGINAWLARAVIYTGPTPIKSKWGLHDVVEYAANGRINQISFNAEGYFHEVRKRTEQSFPNRLVLRGADSQQIGGVASKTEYTRFTRRLSGGLLKELQRNNNRIKLLVEKGIIPRKEAMILIEMNRRQMEKALAKPDFFKH